MSLMRVTRFARVAASRPALYHLGHPHDHGPEWIHKFEKEQKRTGQDSMDWAFRAFNSLGLYENVLKSTPRYFGLMAAGALLTGFYWGLAWEKYWQHVNAGKLYRQVPYVYPAEDEDDE
mmetsp:Transcript_1795/g.4028  ORF Transcript_1795/g.4028 Transcript_1795/m.4028 type:complete len:119 (+) Transcript_1795:76-432(+)|eukprot:CAMPEP_0204251750 /NCGR_PEP_ID=MMETSP0468-20130131/571_1 /ASSEMBLY_ACC=CAM_ASM_000383 /TAXON_ID=2969 /ORGANISM="Oxyrrhis marina" /LENGTH=118 /DNA_ID=CAMNT_0051225075 /DNA_START=61 /DNA_END=417 /DNA_ORIENTATION=-